MPEVHPAVDHVVGYLFEVGPSVGEHPLTFVELEAWQRVTGVRICEFEAFALRQLSGAYLAMRHEASDSKCPSPFMRAATLPPKAEVSNRLRDFLRSMNTPQAKAERAKRRTERDNEVSDG